jgi:uncharacterized membrane protein YfcA
MLGTLSALEIGIASGMMLVGSTVLSTVGFGIGMSTTPVLLLVLDPQTVVILINTVSLVLLVLIIYQTRAHLPVREMSGVSAAGLLAVPVGVFFLSSADASVLRIAITGLIIVLTVVTAFNVQLTIPRPRLTGPVIGFVAALTLTTLGIGGPIMVLFLLTRQWSRHALRGGLSLYFLAVEVTAVIGYGVAGLFTQERIALILITVVPVVAGFGLATLLLRRMNERVFRLATMTVIIATSAMVLAREALSL